MKKLHWTGVFIELAIVVVGVFIGLRSNALVTLKLRFFLVEKVVQSRAQVNLLIQ